MNPTRMKMFSALLAVALLFLTTFGCSSNSLDASSNTVIFTQTKTLGPEGGQLLSDEYGVKVTIEEGMLRVPSVMTLTIFAEQFTGIERPGYLYSPNGVHLTLDPTALETGGTILIEMPHVGTYDGFGTMLAVSRADGVMAALPSQESEPNSVSGTLEQSILEALYADTPTTDGKELTIFTANRELEAGFTPFTTSVRPFIDGAFAGEIPALSGQKVAVIVHGLEANLADLTSLGQFIYDFKRNGESTLYYDVVIGFEYTSNRPLATIGQAMADWMEQVGLQDAAVVDLIAHSMGNPVSRYAIETTDTTLLPNRIANIRNYISLGGPHDGVPFGNLPHLEQTFFYWFKPASKPCLLDLITIGKEGEPRTAFLKDLNLMAGKQGPNFLTTRYFTMSGDDWKREAPPLGKIVHLLYLASFIKSFGTAEGERDDGLVAQYSAQSTLLARQSEAWVPNEPLNDPHLSHTELHTAQEAFDQIAVWLNTK